MSQLIFNKFIGGDVILLNSSFPPLLKFRWTNIEEIYMRLFECGVSLQLTIETIARIIRTKNKDDALLKKVLSPQFQENMFTDHQETKIWKKIQLSKELKIQFYFQEAKCLKIIKKPRQQLK